MEEKNEFDDLEEFSGLEEPTNNNDNNDMPDNDMFSQSNAGKKFDFDNMSSGVKAPSRENMGGEIVDILSAELFIPSLNKEWKKTKNGKNEYKDCPFKLTYGHSDPKFKGQAEFYSGVKVFKSADGKYGQPCIYNGGRTQATKLKGTFAKFMGKSIEEVPDKEFFKALDSGTLRGRIEWQEFEWDDDITNKNIVVEIVPRNKTEEKKVE